MKIQHTPAPYASTVLSLSPAESFPYRDIQSVQAITLDPDTSTYTLSGPRAVHPAGKLQTYTLPADGPRPQAVPGLVYRTVQAEFAQYATPAPSRHLRAVPDPQRQHLADPSGPAPTQAQQDSISRSAARTSSRPPAQPQHLAAPAPGAHRAGR